MVGVFSLLVSQIKQYRLLMMDIQFFGVPALYYLIALTGVGILIDYIFG